MPKKKKDIEIVSVNVKPRNIIALRKAIKAKAAQLFDSEDLTKLDLGFELPEKFLQLDGPPPVLAQLTVLAGKLRMQILIGQIEILPIDDDTENK